MTNNQIKSIQNMLFSVQQNMRNAANPSWAEKFHTSDHEKKRDLMRLRGSISDNPNRMGSENTESVDEPLEDINVQP